MDRNGDDILRYHRGELSAAERHALEKKALSDPFLADALEGAGQISVPDLELDVATLQRRVKGGAKPLFTPLRVAASIALLVAAGWFGLYLMENNQQDQLSLKQQAPESTSGPVAKDTVEAAHITMAEEPTVAPADAPKKDQLLAQQQSARKEKKEEVKNEEQQKEDAGHGPVASEEETKVETDLVEHADLALSSERTAASQDDLLEDSAVAPLAQQPVQSPTGAGELRQARSEAETIIKTQGVAGTTSREIKGTVTLAEDGIALPGVNVRVKGSSLGTVTDLNGKYTLDAGKETPTLVFSFIGMQTAEATPISGSTLDVALTEDVSQLSEVVVTGKKIPSDGDDNPVIKLAEPVGGLKAYDGYLYGNLRYPQQAIENSVKGRVTIQFTVGINGDLNEFTVMKSLGFGCDEEVIRLVKEGPAWKPTTENDVPTESLVRVRVKFDPQKTIKK